MSEKPQVKTRVKKPTSFACDHPHNLILVTGQDEIEVIDMATGESLRLSSLNKFFFHCSIILSRCVPAGKYFFLQNH